MRYRRGDVVLGPDFIGPGEKRPYVVVSGETHPFSGTESIVVAVTTTERDVAVPLEEDSFTRGGLPKESYASPWVLTTLKHVDIDRKSGVLSPGIVERITREIARYVGVGEQG